MRPYSSARPGGTYRAAIAVVQVSRSPASSSTVTGPRLMFRMPPACQSRPFAAGEYDPGLGTVDELGQRLRWPVMVSGRSGGARFSGIPILSGTTARTSPSCWRWRGPISKRSVACSPPGSNARDPLAAQSFGCLSADGLVPDGTLDLLRAAAQTAQDEFLIRLAEALFVLTADPSWAEPIVSVLATAESEFVRLDAAIALAGFAPTRPLVRALARAVCDPDYLVRYHAASTLLRYAGEGADISDDGELFAKIATPAAGAPSEVDRRSWQSAADDLSARVLPKP